MKLVLAEKPSVAQSIAKVLGAAKREDGYLEGNGYVVSWCVGHLVELAQPEVYDAKYSKWAYADLPIFLERSADGPNLYLGHQGSTPVRHSDSLQSDHFQPRLYPGSHVCGAGDLSGAHRDLLHLCGQVAHCGSDPGRCQGLTIPACLAVHGNCIRKQA